jgi:hypothetical protein
MISVARPQAQIEDGGCGRDNGTRLYGLGQLHGRNSSPVVLRLRAVVAIIQRT